MLKAPAVAGVLSICFSLPLGVYADEAEDLYYTRGSRVESRPLFEEAAKRGDADAALYLGRLSMLDYDFPAAGKHYADYRSLKKKSRQAVDPIIADEEASLKEARTLFERVRDLVVIDAYEANRDEFYKQLHLPLSAGRVVDSRTLPVKSDGVELGPTGYISESGDVIMWSQMDEESGLMRICEANILTDGSLSETVMAPEFLGNGGDAINPFLSADGTTLYYASNGDGTIGGYDIFMASRDPQTGEYLQPVNLGIPFNSYGDEYLLAIDEENGVGWWATDRHYLPDNRIVLYLFEWTGERKNLNASDEEKRKRSRLDNIRDTWVPIASAQKEDDSDDEDTDEALTEELPDMETLVRKYEGKAAEIRRIQPGQKPRREDCRIPLGGGKYILSADDVKDGMQKSLVEEYIRLSRDYETEQKELDKMRRRYALGEDVQLGRKIASAENIMQKKYQELTNILSQLYKSIGRK